MISTCHNLYYLYSKHFRTINPNISKIVWWYCIWRCKKLHWNIHSLAKKTRVWNIQHQTLSNAEPTEQISSNGWQCRIQPSWSHPTIHKGTKKNNPTDSGKFGKSSTPQSAGDCWGYDLIQRRVPWILKSTSLIQWFPCFNGCFWFP